MPTKRKHAADEDADDGAADDAFELTDDVYIYSPYTMTQIDESRLNTNVHAVVPGPFLANPGARRTVRLRHLWGTDVYTAESDLLAVLVHAGFVPPDAEAPRAPLLATLRVCARQREYPSSTRHGLCSRACAPGEHTGVSYKVVRCAAYSGDLVELEPRLSNASTGRRALPSVSLLAPGYPPSSLHVMFDLCDEPMYKYSLALVADRGLEPKDWTSTRLRTEALYLESETQRFQLCRAEEDTAVGGDGGDEAHGGPRYDAYSFCEVLEPETVDAAAMRRLGVPLPPAHVRLVHGGLDWEDIGWGLSSVRIKGKEYPLLRLKFAANAAPDPAA